MMGELVAIDGSKFAGVSHKSRNFNAEKLARRLALLDEKIAAYLKALETNDDAEAGSAKPDRETIRQALKALEAKQTELRTHQAALAGSGDRQISLTDPDSRAMNSGSGGAVVGYNVQLSVDAAHKLIVDFEVTNDGNDRNPLAPQAKAAKDLLQVDHLDVVADAGYAHGAQYAACEAAGITPYVPDCETHNNEHHGRFGKQRFAYDGERDQYRCPAGEILTYAGTSSYAGHPGRRYRTPACTGCAWRDRCTGRTRHGREIVRVQHAEAVEAMARRVENHPEKLKQRKELVEHPFGTIKRTMNQGYFLLKRIPKVTTEMSLTVLCYNLRRVVNILGTENLMRHWVPA